MAILSVREIAGKGGGIGPSSERNYERRFRVVTDSRLTGVRDVLSAAGLPVKGDIYATADELDSGARCKSRDAAQDDDNPAVWVVTCHYDTTTEEQDEEPTQRRTRYRWGTAQFQRVAWKDIDGKAIVNSAGQYFDPPIEVDDSRPTLTVTRIERTYNQALAIQYQDAVNSDSFLGFAPGQVKVASIEAEDFEENGVIYWTVKYEFHFRREGWIKEPLDQGRYEKWGNFLVPIKERDEDGNELDTYVSDPVPLDGQGKRLDNPGPDSCKYLSFKVYKSLAFRAFNF